MAKSNKLPAQVGHIKAILANNGISVQFNVISGTPVITGMPNAYSQENAANTLPVLLYDRLKTNPILHATRQDVLDAITLIMDENRFNPVADIINMAPFDGTDRISEFEDILGITDNTYSCMLFEKWLHQTIAMALNDETEPYGADGVLVLQGEQGEGKTLCCRKLAIKSDLFAEGVSIDLNTKDSVIQATKVWIAELGELDSTLKREQSSLKAFLTSQVDTYRPPYARASINRIRRTSFCATVNPKEFLNDETGSRRFWVIPIKHIDVDRLKALTFTWLQQFWRQVYENMYLPNPQGFRLTKDERKSLQQRNHEYDKPIPGEIEIMDALHFDLPDDRWDWYKISEVMQILDLRISSSQAGKALAKIESMQPKVLVKKPGNVKQYYLPLRTTGY